MIKRILVCLLVLLFLSPFLLFGLGLFFFIFGGIVDFAFQTVYWIAVGWIYALFQLSDGFRYEVPALAVGVLAVIALPFMLHYFVWKTFKKPVRWKFRQSLAVVGIACSLIVATIGMIAAIHEVYWIVHTEETMLETWSMGQRIDLKTGVPLDEPQDSTP